MRHSEAYLKLLQAGGLWLGWGGGEAKGFTCGSTVGIRQRGWHGTACGTGALPCLNPGRGAKPVAESRRSGDGCIQSRAEGARPGLPFLGAALRRGLPNVPPIPRGAGGVSAISRGAGGCPWGWGVSVGLQVSHGTTGHGGAEPGKFPSPPPSPPLERLLLTFGLICMWVGGWK